MPIHSTIKKLTSIPGLGNVYKLTEEDKQIIKELEVHENHGVHACLARSVTLALTHNSQFRPPAMPIVEKRDEKHYFPTVPFPEVTQDNVVSSSPGRKVHDFLVRRFNLKLKEEDATLLVGFN